MTAELFSLLKLRIDAPFIRIPWKATIIFNSHCKAEIFRVTKRVEKKPFAHFVLVHKLVFLGYNHVLRQANFHFSTQGIRQRKEHVQSSFLGQESLVFGTLPYHMPGLGWHRNTHSLI